MAANRPLVLTVDAQVDPLQRALSAGSVSMAQFGASAAQSIQQTTDAFAQLGTQPGNAARAMEQSFASAVRNMQTAAQQAVKMGADYNPLGGMTASSSHLAAQKLEELAAAETARARAAAAAIPIDEEQAALLRVLATSSTAAASSFLQQAQSMTAQAEALALVETEIKAAGAATVVAGSAQNDLHSNTQRLNLGQMELAHVARAVADSYAAGIPISRIAAMEIGRISEAMMFYAAQSNNTTGFMSKFAGVMGGPWGLAITLGIPLVTSLVGHIMEMGQETEKATEKLKEQAQANQIAKVAQSAFDQTLLGSIEVERKLNDELSKQLKTRRELNMEKVGQAQQNINVANKQVSDAQERANAAKIKMDSAAASRNAAAGFVGTGGVSSDSGAFDRAKSDYTKAVADLAQARALAARTERDLREAQAVYSNDRNQVLSGKNGKEQLQIEAEQGRLNREYTRPGSAMTFEQFDKASKALADRLAALGHDEKPMSGAAENSLGNMVALLKQIVPGVRITSTTGGVHTKNSDHYSGHAIDFVPAGGMGAISFDEMRKLLEDAGVKIRRNANGTEQFFGPGHGPGGSNDHSHDNHYHVAWTGSASPESAERTAAAAQRKREEAERKVDESKKSYAAESDSLDKELLQYQAKHINSLKDEKDAVDATIDAEKKKRDDTILAEAKAKGWTKAATDALLLKEDEVTKAKKAANQRDYDDKLQASNSAQAKFMSEAQNKLLNIQLDMATTLEERRKIARQLLDSERKEALAQIDADDKLTPEQKTARRGAVDAEYNGKQKQQDITYQDPMQAFARKLKTNTQDMNTALKSVEADGLQSLEDGMMGIVNGTETVASAFKKMATSIIADIARIAIEKAIFAVIGLKDGGSAGGALHLADGGGAGLVTGSGGSRQDNIHAMLSPGEFVINASSTARHRKLIEAINDNDPRLLHLASGGLVDVSSVAYPAIPAASALAPRAGGSPAPIVFNLQGAVMTADLLQQMNSISARYAAATMVTAPEVARANLQSSARRNIP